MILKKLTEKGTLFCGEVHAKNDPCKIWENLMQVWGGRKPPIVHWGSTSVGIA